MHDRPPGPRRSKRSQRKYMVHLSNGPEFLIRADDMADAATTAKDIIHDGHEMRKIVKMAT